jgi:hypothetical protein
LFNQSCIVPVRAAPQDDSKAGSAGRTLPEFKTFDLESSDAFFSRLASLPFPKVAGV